MYTELNDEEVFFQAHEIVKIVRDIISRHQISNSIESSTFFPHDYSYQEFINSITQKTNDLDVIEGALDQFITIPLSIQGLSSPDQWLFVTRKLHELYQRTLEQDTKISVEEQSGGSTDQTLISDTSKYILIVDEKGKLKEFHPKPESLQNEDLIQGTWIHIAGRLILVKNTAQMTYYISDHGFLPDIISKVEHLAFEFDWLNAELMLKVVALDQELKNKTGAEKSTLRAQLIKSIRDDEIENLRKAHSGKTDEKLKQMVSDYTKNPIISFLDFEESSRYVIFALFKKFMQMKALKPNFDKEIYQDFGLLDDHEESNLSESTEETQEEWEDRSSDAQALIKRMVVIELAKEINLGKHEPLFRPVESYGKGEKGPSYHDFAETIKKYFEQPQHLTQTEIAQKMRAILQGKSPDLDNVSFIPSLVSAWFIAEPTRNPSSIISGLMMLDMLENNAQLEDDKKRNWYDLYHMLVHPNKDSAPQSDVQDLYDTKTGIDRFGGSHPMAHGGSVNESIEMRPKEKLSKVYQKEASLYFDWLKRRMDSIGIASSLKSFKEQKLKELDVDFSQVSRHYSDSEALTTINNKIRKVEGTIRLKTKEGKSPDKANKELTQYKEVQKKLLLKQIVTTQVIIPLLMERLSNFANQLDAEYSKARGDKVTLTISPNGDAMYNEVIKGLSLAAITTIGSQKITSTGLRNIISQEIKDNYALYREALEFQLLECVIAGEITGFHHDLSNKLWRLRINYLNMVKEGKGSDLALSDTIKQIQENCLATSYSQAINNSGICGGVVELGILSKLLQIKFAVQLRDQTYEIDNSGAQKPTVICLDYNRNNCHVILPKYDSEDIKRILHRAESSRQNTQTSWVSYISEGNSLRGHSGCCI